MMLSQFPAESVVFSLILGVWSILEARAIQPAGSAKSNKMEAAGTAMVASAVTFFASLLEGLATSPSSPALPESAPSGESKGGCNTNNGGVTATNGGGGGGGRGGGGGGGGGGVGVRRLGACANIAEELRSLRIESLGSPPQQAQSVPYGAGISLVAQVVYLAQERSAAGTGLAAAVARLQKAVVSSCTAQARRATPRPSAEQQEEAAAGGETKESKAGKDDPGSVGDVGGEDGNGVDKNQEHQKERDMQWGAERARLVRALKDVRLTMSGVGVGGGGRTSNKGD